MVGLSLDSGWCLAGAAAMLNPPGLIITLVYYANPEKGFSTYKLPFLKYNSNSDQYPREESDNWKDALQQICSRSGWSITEGLEAQLGKTLAINLIKMLGTLLLEVNKHPLGMDCVKKALIQKLNQNLVEEVVEVGIWGIGGIGKTTVVKAVYNQVYGYFNGASFVFNVRATTADTTGLLKLQRQKLKDLTIYDEDVDSVDKGKSMFRNCLGGKHVLLILDGVEQLLCLAGDIGCCWQQSYYNF